MFPGTMSKRKLLRKWAWADVNVWRDERPGAQRGCGGITRRAWGGGSRKRSEVS